MPDWGDTRVACFLPVQTDNLRPSAIPFVGKVLEFEFSGTMDEGPYDGQSIWEARDRSLRLGWIPDEDLVDVPRTEGGEMMTDPNKPEVGDVIEYVDELSVSHNALVTVYFGGNSPNGALNCTFLSSDPQKSDPYGRQIERASSVSRESEHTAHGRFWRPKQ